MADQGTPATAPAGTGNLSARLNSITAYLSNASVVFYLVFGTAIALLTAFILYRLINNTVNNQLSYLLPDTKVPILTTEEHSFPADAVPNSGNGKRLSLSFWIYVYDIQKGNGVRRHILHRGNETDTDLTGGASPYIYLDPYTNKLYITFAPNDATKLYNNTIAGGSDYSNKFIGTSANATPQEQINYLNAVRGTTIDYLPLQRWVHVTVVINEDATTFGTITTYVDGQLVKSVSQANPNPAVNLNQLTANGTPLNPAPQFSIADVNLDIKGNVYTGGATGSPVGIGFSGMVSMIKFFNYDLNSNDVYSEYRKGPIDNLLSKVGLPAYKLQSPLVRVG